MKILRHHTDDRGYDWAQLKNGLSLQLASVSAVSEYDSQGFTVVVAGMQLYCRGTAGERDEFLRAVLEAQGVQLPLTADQVCDNEDAELINTLGGKE